MRPNLPPSLLAVVARVLLWLAMVGALASGGRAAELADASVPTEAVAGTATPPYHHGMGLLAALLEADLESDAEADAEGPDGDLADPLLPPDSGRTAKPVDRPPVAAAPAPQRRRLPHASDPLRTSHVRSTAPARGPPPLV